MIENNQYYDFGEFRVDTANKVLLKSGEPISLTPKIFQTLLVLLENAGTLVSKDEFMQKIWKDSFVEDGNLTFNIKVLRKALGDDANNPQFIETIPRQGYRFIAEVNQVEIEKPSRLVPQSDSTTRIRHILPALAIILVLGIFGFAIYRANSDFTPTKTFLKMKMNRITSAGKTFYAVISPDGKYIIHAQDEGGKQSLWIRQTDESRDVEILPAVSGEFLGFTVSPDNQRIYCSFIESNRSDATLFSVPILGGTAKTVINDIASGVSFSPNGKEMAFYRTSPSRGSSQLFIANSYGSNERLISERKAPDTFETEFGVPVWHPDGKRLIVIGASNTSGKKSTLLEIELTTGSVKPFVDLEWKEILQIAWLKSSNGLLAVIFDEEADSQQIWHIDPKTGLTRKISDDLSNYRGISLSDNEQVLITTKTEKITRLWITSNDMTKELLSETGTSSGKEGFAWTPDNKLVFRNENLGNNEIWIYDQEGKHQLTFDQKGNRQPTVCNNGKEIVFASNQTETLRLWKMTLDGKKEQLLTNETKDSEMYPHCSVNSDWVVYQKSWRRPTIWKVPVSGGEPIQLTKTLSLRPTISPDGKMVAFYSLEEKGWGITVVSLDDGAILNNFSLQDSVISRNLRWTPDGKNLAYTDTRNGFSNIWLQPLDGNEPRQLTNFDSELIFYFDWSPNEKNFACYRGTISNNVVAFLNVE